MSPLLALPVLVILIAVFVIYWFGFLVLSVTGLFVKDRRLKWVGLVPLIAMTAIAVLYLISFATIETPERIYAATFKAHPTPDVLNIRRSTPLRFNNEKDGVCFSLAFRASTETFHRLLPKTLERATFESCKQNMPPVVRTGIWPNLGIPLSESISELYLSNSQFHSERKFAKEIALMTYDEEAQEVGFFYLGTN